MKRKEHQIKKSIDLGVRSVKDVDSKNGIVKFAFAAYDKVDSDQDIIHSGAYKKSYDERGPKGTGQIKHFKWHSDKYVPGKLLEVYDEGGYGIAVSQLSKSTLGRDTLIEYQEKLITEHSHGFNQLNPRNQDDKGINHITEGFLWEVSSLTGWGAQSDTPMLELKDLKDEQQALQMLEVIHKYLSVGELSDETLKKFETKLKQLETILSPLDGTGNQPLDSTKDEWKYIIENIKL